MRGQRPVKNPELLRGHRRHRNVIPLDDAPTRAAPPCPAQVLPETRRIWRSLWKSRVATAWDRSSDLPALTRYVRLLDRWLRYDALVAEAPMVRGSKGQVRSNPLASRMDALESQVRWLEEQLGLTPAGRMRLGISLIEPRRITDFMARQRTWEERRAELEDPDPDPREILREPRVVTLDEAMNYAKEEGI